MRLLGAHPSDDLDAAAVEHRALAAAATLHRRGIRAGDRVCVKLGNGHEFVVALLALVHLDTSIALVDQRCRPAELRRRAASVGASIILVDRDRDRGVPGSVPVADVLGSVADIAPDDDELQLKQWRQRRDALVTWTSGTRTVAKGVVRDGDRFAANIEASAARMGYRTTDVLAPLLPFSHQYGLSLVLLAHLCDTGLLVSSGWRVREQLHLLAARRATVADAVPATYQQVLDVLQREPELVAELASVRMWCVGGAALAPATATRFRRTVRQPLVDGYGMTETGNISLATPDEPAGCGRPVDGVRVTILGEDGMTLPPGSKGEIAVRTPYLAEAFLGAGGELHPVTDELFRTGDLGWMDENGAVHVEGRMGAVTRNGHTLTLAAIEAEAQTGECVVAVEAQADERRGARLVFAVEDALGRSRSDWRQHFKDVLPPEARPDLVVVLERMPRLATGDIDRRKLSAIVAAMGEQPAPSTPRTPARPVGARSAATATKAVRSDALTAVADFLDARHDDVVDLLTETSPLAAVAEEVAAATATLRGAAQEVERSDPPELGRLAAFMPSNQLLYSYVLYLLVPSLYVRELRFRPASATTGQFRRLHDLLAAVHRLPVHLMDGSQQDFTDEAVDAADLVVFTGRFENAREVRARLRPEQLFAFFGQGVNPFVVTASADPRAAVDGVCRIRLFNSGQDCLGPDIVYVHESIADVVLAQLEDRIRHLRFGENRDEGTDYGPLAFDNAFSDAVDFLSRNRGRIRAGGRADIATRTLEPTLLVHDDPDALKVPELFAPVFNVCRYSDEGALASRLDSGWFTERALGATVYGSADRLVASLRRRHMVSVDETLLDLESGNEPFGGYGQRANFVGVGGRVHSHPILLSAVVAHYTTVAA